MSRKCDLTISRNATYNTGNYGNVRPEVTLTIKDIDVGNLPAEYEALSDVVSGMFALELKDCIENIKQFDRIGSIQYAGSTDVEAIKKAIEDFSKRHLFEV